MIAAVVDRHQDEAGRIAHQADAVGMEILRRAGELCQMRRALEGKDIETVLRRRLAARHRAAVEGGNERAVRLGVDGDVFGTGHARDRTASPREARRHIGEDAIGVERAHAETDNHRRQHGAGGHGGAKDGAHQLASAMALVNCRSARRA